MERIDTATESAAPQKGISWGKVLLGVAAVGAIAVAVVSGFGWIGAMQPMTAATLGTAGAGAAAVALTGSEAKFLEAAEKSKQVIEDEEKKDSSRGHENDVETAAMLAGSAGANYWLNRISTERGTPVHDDRGTLSYQEKLQAQRDVGALTAAGPSV